MTPDAAGPVEAVLAEHTLRKQGTGQDVGCWGCDWTPNANWYEHGEHVVQHRAHVAAALAPLFAAHGAAERRAGAVAALRNAADNVLNGAPVGNESFSARQIADHLEARARGVEREARAVALGDRTGES